MDEHDVRYIPEELAPSVAQVGMHGFNELKKLCEEEKVPYMFNTTWRCMFYPQDEPNLAIKVSVEVIKL